MEKLWSQEETKERFPLPISPMGWSLLAVPAQSTLDSLAQHLFLRRVGTEDILKNIDSYVYARKGFFRTGVLKKIKWISLFVLSLKILFWTITSFFLNSNLGLKLNFKAHLMEKLFFSRADYMLRKWDLIQKNLLEKMRSASAGDIQKPIHYLEFLEKRQLMEKNSCEYFYFDFAVYFLKNLFYHALLYFLKEVGLNTEEAKNLLSQITQGLPQNFAIQMALEYVSLPRDQWIEKYGHLTDNWDVAAPTLAESEKLLRKTISQTQAKTLAEMHLAHDSLRKETEKKFALYFHQDPRLMQALNYFQKLLLVDEDMRAFSSLQYPAIRQLFQRVALTAQWKFEDIFFLSITEVEESLKNQDFSKQILLAQQRRLNFEKALKTIPPEEFKEVSSKLTAIQIHKTVAQGKSVSPGKVSAPALVIKSLNDFKSFTGQEILVLKSATPTYTMYYSQSLGIISETGGLLSHGALVAREFHIPMISNVSGVLEVVKNGDMILLDATNGTYKIMG